MSTNTKYQKAKIIVEETRRLYLQIILLVGIFLFIIVRTIISRNFLLMPSFTFVGENVSYSPELSIIQSPFLFSLMLLLSFQYL
ncbi:hypothetical protein [Methanobrevibacter arboriphilus]|uniref:hypothetical protein n=1 Tax=Methanobrevibacter arboriphilus TaxID=39441 RepID=UPI000A93D222|nr:hypothetical protein [Methanobrevibacter arboriphilus]